MGRKLDEPAVADVYNRALDLEAAGRIDEAVAAYRHLLELDPADHGGAGVRLAALGHGPAPGKAPEAYVETLFDQNAHRFEDVLVDALGYGVPALMAEALAALKLGPYQRMLDLGCGTGLAAEAMRDRVEEIIGLDISSRMIDICEEKDIYEGLYCGEVEEFLEDNDEPPFDLITACDVLPYIGDVRAMFAGVAAALTPKGVFSFSSEILSDQSGEYAVSAGHRYVHSESYLRRQLDLAGFEVLGLTEINVRMENDAPSPGHLVVARLR